MSVGHRAPAPTLRLVTWPAGVDVSRWDGALLLRLARAQGDERAVAVGRAHLLVDERPSLVGVRWPDAADALEVLRLGFSHVASTDHAEVWLTDDRADAVHTERLRPERTGLAGTILVGADADGRIVALELLEAGRQLPALLLEAIRQAELADAAAPPPPMEVAEPAPEPPPRPLPEVDEPDPEMSRWNAALDEWAERHRWQATLGSALITGAPVVPVFLWAGEPTGVALLAGAAVTAMVVAICLVCSWIVGRPVVPVPFRRGSDPA